MKTRDTFLFGLPLAAALLIGAFAWFLYAQISRFEQSYLTESKKNIAQETRLVSAVISPMLNAGDLRSAVSFCRSFDSDSLRLTLIESGGKVAADSFEKEGLPENHLERSEVKSAFAGRPSTTVRYSESLGRWMLYHAIPLKTSRGDFVLRAAISTDQVGRIIDFARLNMFWALLFGGEIVLLLTFYLMKRVRKPLLDLQESVDSIASGNLDSRIDIPESGVIRDLALGVSDMAEQLKNQLNAVTIERNEKNAILDSMGEAVLLFAANGDLIRHNKAAANLFSLTGPDLRFNLARCGISELLPLARKTLMSGEPFEHEFSFSGTGTPSRLLFIKGSLLEGRGGARFLLLTVTELTGLRKLESFRSDFVANVSHEIKTPLTCILGAVEALEEFDALSEAHRKQLLGILTSQSNRLNNLVQDILSLAALEKKQLDFTREFGPVALDSMVVNSVNLCRKRAEESGFRLEIEKNEPLVLDGDTQLLEQVVVNLIQNAIKYSGGKTIGVSLTREPEGPSALLTVRDDGIGIAREHQSRIFERFYRVDKARSRALGGTGLGLAIVKHIARLHGGTADVSSEFGHGCEFRIRLPLKS